MSDTRTPHEKIADRLAAATQPGVIFDRGLYEDQHLSYADSKRLSLRASHEYSQLNLED